MPLFAFGNSGGLNTVAGLAVAVMTSIAALPSAAWAAGQPTSSYSDIGKCATLEEGDDAFVLRCKGPGGATAILQYVESRVGLFFGPAVNNGHEVAADELYEIKPSGKVFPGKLEWRSLAGAKSPCAAIIRVPVARGPQLMVFDLSSGAREGQTADNQTARNIADDICQRTSAQPASTAPASAAGADLEPSISQGLADFDQTYRQNGVSGVAELVDDCYLKASSAEAVARCATIDVRGNETDTLFSSQYGTPRYAYFQKPNPKLRLDAAIKRLKFSTADKAALKAIANGQ